MNSNSGEEPMNNLAMVVPAALNSAIDIIAYGVAVLGVLGAAFGFYLKWTTRRRGR